MKKIILSILVLFSLNFAIDLLNSLEARPGGGSSYRSSSSGSSRSSGSSSSYRSSGSSGSSYRSSGGGGGGSGTPMTKAGVMGFFAFVFFTIAIMVFMVTFPEKPFDFSSWQKSNFYSFISVLVLLSITAYLSYRGDEMFLVIFLGVLLFMPFLIIYYAFKNIFGTKERIFIAKGKK